MILLIDNYDSFTYNLVHYLEDLNCEVTVVRNDKLDLNDVEPYDKVLLSPGPGIPDEAGLLKTIIKTYASSKSILGVCLGQQAIGEVFGGQLINLDDVYHGVATNVIITVDDESLFKGLDKNIEVGRYHSWVVDTNLPDVLEATSFDEPEMPEFEAGLMKEGIAVDRTTLRPAWESQVSELLREATLDVPEMDHAISGGRDGVHTEHLGHMLSDLQYVQRAYPGLQW